LLPDATDQELGSALRKWREGLGLKVYQLAEKAEISQGYLSDIENGRRRLNDDTADKIVAALNLKFEELEQLLADRIRSERPRVLIEDRVLAKAAAESFLREQPQPYGVNLPGLAAVSQRTIGMEGVARHFVTALSKQDAAALVTRFMSEYQAGDESGLAKANAITHILSEP
jgi:transcriptional regulator with XRE-family HTH domain